VETTAARLERAARAVLVAFVVAFLVTVATGSGSSTAAGRLGGDYPAFYSAGRIVLDGDASHLYEPARQEQAQHDLFGGEHDGFLYFAYPPPVAALYAPLAALPYRLSYALHTLLMAGALVLALRVLRPIVPMLGRRFWLSSVLAVAFFPMFRAIGGGQNTALTVLLIALAWRAVHERRQVWCGVAIGLLLFKPQLALLFLLLLFVTKRWRSLAAAAGVAGATFLAGAAVAGWDWPVTWLSRAQWFSALDAQVNAGNAISFLGAAHAAFGEHALWATAIAALLSAATVLVVVRVWRFAPPDDLAAPFALAAAGGLLAVPHVMFYDAGLLVLTGIGVLAVDDRRARAVLGVLGAAGIAHVLSGYTPANPLFLVTCAAFLLAFVTADSRARPQRARPQRQPVDVNAPLLSIVIPAYNEAQRIGPTLDAVAAYAQARNDAVEVIVVDDGSTDGAGAVLDAARHTLPELRVVHHERNRGKGAAVRTGMLAASGQWRVFMDADMSTPVTDIDRLLATALEQDADVAIGSIAVRGASIDSRQSVVRTVLGTLGSFVIRLAVLPGIHDTQRGIKLFSAQATEDVFSIARSDGWGFDVEALALARAQGYDIKEVGVRWSHCDGGSVRAHAYVRTLTEVVSINRRIKTLELAA